MGFFFGGLTCKKDLLNAMIIHASTGVWPDSAEAAVKVVRGDVTVTLALE